MIKLFYITLFAIVALGLNIGCSKSNKPTDANCVYEQDSEVVTSYASSGAIFLFGERHGTNEAPSFIANFACKIAKDSDDSTIVLLELPIPDLLSDPSNKEISIEEAKRLILAEGDVYWTGSRDGRTSVAMMNAILRILYLREQGLDISLGSTMAKSDDTIEGFGIDLTFADEYTFDNLYFKEAARILRYKSRFKNVIVLNGRAHTRNHIRFYKKANVETPYIGFVQGYGGGSEWNCQEDECGVHATIPAYEDLVGDAEHGSLVLFDERRDELYKGAYVFKTISPSPPYSTNISQ